jgi:hypothetical protein
VAVGSFEPLFFGNLVLALECCFVHRARGLRGQGRQSAEWGADALEFDSAERGVLMADKTIKYKPETSVLTLKIGGKIELSAAEFARLAEAFFAEMETKFV